MDLFTKSGQSVDLQARFGAPVNSESPTVLGPDDMEQVLGAASFTQLINMTDSVDMPTLRLVLLGAEGGNLGRLFEAYQKMVSSDARIFGMVRNRKLAVARAAQTLTVDEDNSVAVAARDLVEKNLKLLSFTELQEQLLDGIFYGVALFEKVWVERDGELLVENVHRVQSRRIRQNNSFTSSGSGRQPDERFGELQIVTGDFGSDRRFLDEFGPYKFMAAVARDNPGEYSYHSVFRSVARWWVLKNFILQTWAQFTEKYGVPLAIVKMPKSEYEKNKQAVKKVLQSVGANRYGLFFENMTYEIQNAAQAGNVEVFKSYIELCNTEIAIAILGQNLTTEVSGGSFAAAKTHENVLSDIIASDMEWLDSIIQHQLVEPLVRVNFPSLAPEDYPVFVSKTKRDVDLVQLSSGLSGMNRLIDIPKAWVYESAQIPQPADGEDVIEAQTQNPLDRAFGN